jgi:hypothetical protein
VADRHRELELRRARLLARSTELRMAVGQQAQVLRTPLAVADQVRDGARWLRQHPEWPIGALVVLVILRPRRVFRWSSRLFWGWQMWRRARPVLQRIMTNLPR